MVRSDKTWRKNAHRASRLIPVAALSVLLTAAGLIGVTGVAGAITPNTLTAVGSFAQNEATGLPTANATLVNSGDLLVIWVKNLYPDGTPNQVISISGTGTGAVGTPQLAIQYDTVSHPNNDDEIWYAPVTNSGPITLHFTWSGSTSSDMIQYSTQEFQPSAASNYGLDTALPYENSVPSLTMQFPTLTPANADELYVGYNSNDTSGSYSASVTDYTQKVLGDGDVVLFNPSVTGVQSPSATALANDSSQSSIGALLVAVPNTDNVVNFDSQGGSAVASQYGATGDSITTLPTAPTYPGHHFNGWFSEASGGSPETSYTITSASSVTLYAQWGDNASDAYSFAAGGGTGTAPASSSGLDGTTIILPANPFTLNGDTFTGWSNGTTTYAANASYLLSSNGTPIVFTAQWVPTASDAYSFAAGGGTGTAPASSSGLDGTTIILPANPFTLNGDTFTGWSNGTTTYAANASYLLSSNGTPIVFTAQWVPTASDAYSFAAGGGTGTAPASSSGLDGTTIILPANPFTLNGDTFTGWSNGTTTYAANASYLLSSNGTPIVFTAQWTTSGGGGGGGGVGVAPTLGTLSVTAGSLNITVGQTVTPTASVGGLKTGDSASASNVTFTYAGTGSTMYAASTTAPSAAGTYSVTPSGATVTVTPSADAADYSSTLSYVPGTLVIAAKTIVTPPPTKPSPHASRVVGTAFVGRTRTITIVGTGFTNGSRVTSNEVGATVRVRSVSATRIVITITLRRSLHAGRHTFTITSPSGKTCRVNYVAA